MTQVSSDPDTQLPDTQQEVSYLSPLLRRPGAVPADGKDAGVAWHYGDPVAEQRALEQGSARVDLSHRGVVTITGPDRLTWLHSLTTQHLSGLAPYTSAETLILSPKGHIEHDLHLVDDGETTWITVEPGTAPALADWLTRMQFMLRVDVQDVTQDWAVVGELRDAESAPGEVLAWRDPWPDVAEGGVSYSSNDEHPAWHFRELLVPRPELEAAAGARLAGLWALDALRVAAWRPRLGFETDHRTIPHEADWLRTAVHMQKGCYRGQETVARVHNLGRPPRRLVMLHLDGSEHIWPPAGTDVQLDGRTIGRITTVARHHELGPIALAMVKRNAPIEATLQVDGIAAAQEQIVTP
jgi:tRNA-modifying protein YgfZ